MIQWISIVYQRPVAALNTLWHYLEQPERETVAKISLYFDPLHQPQADWLEKQSLLLFSRYQKKVPVFEHKSVDQQEIERFRSSVRKELSKCRDKVIIDATSGRKSHSALLLLLGELFIGNVKHVYYNFLKEETYAQLPYPAIPADAITIIDLLDK